MTRLHKLTLFAIAVLLLVRVAIARADSTPTPTPAYRLYLPVIVFDDPYARQEVLMMEACDGSWCAVEHPYYLVQMTDTVTLDYWYFFGPYNAALLTIYYTHPVDFTINDFSQHHACFGANCDTLRQYGRHNELLDYPTGTWYSYWVTY